jgi:hypothetical protein
MLRVAEGCHCNRHFVEQEHRDFGSGPRCRWPAPEAGAIAYRPQRMESSICCSMYSTTEAMITIAAISMGHSIRRPPIWRARMIGPAHCCAASNS